MRLYTRDDSTQPYVYMKREMLTLCCCCSDAAMTCGCTADTLCWGRKCVRESAEREVESSAT